MRMDSVMRLPRQMMLGAMQDPAFMYQYGRLVGEQCKRIGIQVIMRRWLMLITILPTLLSMTGHLGKINILLQSMAFSI